MRARLALIIIGTVLFGPVEVFAASNVSSQCLALDPYLNPDEAISVCGEVIEFRDLSSKALAEVHLKRALGYYWLYRDDLALVEVNEAIKLDPDLGRAYLRRAWIYLFMGRHGEAYDDLSAAVERDPQSADVYVALSFACNWPSCGSDKQLQLLNQALSFKPDHYLARLNRAELLFYAFSRTEDALADLHEILSADPVVVDHTPIRSTDLPRPYKVYGLALRSRAKMATQLQQWDKALADYQYLVEHYPDNPLGYHWKAEVYYRDLKDKVRAIAELDRAIEIDPNYDDARVLRAWTHLLLNNQQEAIADASRVIERGIQAPSADAYEVRARVLEAQGDYNQALADLQIAAQRDPKKLVRYQKELIQAGYFFGKADGVYSEELSYGLTACLIDPQC